MCFSLKISICKFMVDINVNNKREVFYCKKDMISGDFSFPDIS